MNIAAFLSVLGLFLGFLSAAFFAISVLASGTKTTFELASTYWDFNKNVVTSLSQQRAEYIAGTTLLFASFLLQFSAYVLSMPAEQRLQALLIYSVLGAVVAAAMIGVVVFKGQAMFARRMEMEVLAMARRAMAEQEAASQQGQKALSI